MDEEGLTRFESKIYAFSVEVFSFVKTLMNQNVTNPNTSGLLKSSNQLYSYFLDLIDNHSDENKALVKKKCIDLASHCAEYLKKIEVKGNLLNERVNLLIEAKELTKSLEQFKHE